MKTFSKIYVCRSACLSLHVLRHVEQDEKVAHHAQLGLGLALVQKPLALCPLDELLDRHLHEAIVVLGDGLPCLRGVVVIICKII